MAIGAFWFSVMSLLVKIGGRRLPSMELVLWRGVLTLLFSWAALRHAGVPIWGRNRKLLLARGVLGTMALACFFFSLVHLPLGEATLIQYMNPVFATILAALFVGERMRGGDLFCIGASLCGVLLITRPAALFGGAASPLDPTHVAIALSGAFCSGAAYAVVRKMGTSEHGMVVVFYLPLTTVPLSLPLAAREWVWPVGWEWLVILGIGVTTQAAQVYMTRGLQLERAARATATGYLQIVFAGIWGALLLGERPTAWSVSGALLIVGSTLAMTWLHQSERARVEPPAADASVSG
jgi:drug/metabolite transporter (DMT)-like permease